jgi:hypothetical protein
MDIWSHTYVHGSTDAIYILFMLFMCSRVALVIVVRGTMLVGAFVYQTKRFETFVTISSKRLKLSDLHTKLSDLHTKTFVLSDLHSLKLVGLESVQV